MTLVDPTSATSAGTALGRDRALELGNEHGWPFYLASVERLETNISRLRRALVGALVDPEISYSLKTNYLAAFVRAARDQGLTAEAVSELEFEYALHLGYAHSEILVNGAGKSETFLARALTGGARLNVDSVDELEAVSALGAARGQVVDIGVRVSFSFSEPSRFGLDLDDPDVLEAVRRIHRRGWVRVRGAHCHTSARRSPTSFGRRLRRLAESYQQVAGSGRPTYLDVGGGMMGALPGDLAEQLPEPAAGYGDYADVLGATMRSLYADDQPRLVVEPGTGLLADTMSLYATVTCVKDEGGRTTATTTASYLDVAPLRGTVNPSVRVVEGEGPYLDQGPVRLVGTTCMEIDVLHRGLRAPSRGLRTGDVVEFRNVGAYTISMRPAFIGPTPSVLALDGSGPPARVLRPRQSILEFAAQYGAGR
jgi:diaminopimelate decarboxylase